MTDIELVEFGDGYIECRTRLISELMDLLKSDGDLRSSLDALVLGLIEEGSKENWLAIRDKHPGKTRAEFERLLVEYYMKDRQTFLSATGQARLELVQN